MTREQTREWQLAHKQQTFWLTPEEEAAFAAACKAKGITKSKALRETVLAMLATLEPQNA